MPVARRRLRGGSGCGAKAGDEPVVVDAGGVAFIASVGSEVEGDPHERTPEPRALAHGRPGVLVEDRLPFLGVPGAIVLRARRGIELVLVDACTRAVLGDG